MKDHGTQRQTCPPFEEHVKSAIHQLRGAVAELVASMGADPGHPQEMSRILSLKLNLTWKIAKLLSEPDPYAAIPFIPGKQGLNIFLSTLKKDGASDKSLAAVRQAVKEFDRMVEIHAGDRKTLEMMLGNLTRDGGQQRDEQHRKLAYLGNSATFGVQAKAQVIVNIIAPSKVSDKVDLAWVTGLVDFRRLRYNIPWAVAMARKFETEGDGLDVGTIEPLDPNLNGKDCVPLLPEFCSQPLPEVRQVPVSSDMLRYEIEEGSVGNTAAVTCMVGLFGRAFVTRYKYGTNTLGEHIARLGTPVEYLIHDLYVHDDLSYAFSPDISFYNQLPCAPEYPVSGRDQGLLPVHEKVVELGQGLSGILTSEFPDYKPMIKSVYDRLNWKASEFHGFRFKMRYPPIPSLAVLRYDLVDGP